MAWKILAVDDDSNNLMVIEEAFEGHDYELQTASSGQEALEKVKSFKPDLVLLDVMMPGMDGYEVCERMRRMPELEPVVIIMVTAKVLIEEEIKGREAGADDYIVKPFDVDNLIESIKFFLTTSTNINR
jgi:DNA-binding response OmpR family regulator